MTAPAWLNGGIHARGGLLLPYKRVFILALVALCVVAIYLYVTRSAPGRRMRAVMQNREMAACLGLSTARVDARPSPWAPAWPAWPGCALTLLGSIGPALGTYYIVDAFMVVVLGGVGQIAGTILAALAIGGFNTVFELGQHREHRQGAGLRARSSRSCSGSRPGSSRCGRGRRDAWHRSC